MKWIKISKGVFCKVVKPTPTLVLHVLCFDKTKKDKENKKDVLSDIIFGNVLSEHVHSSRRS